MLAACPVSCRPCSLCASNELFSVLCGEALHTGQVAVAVRRLASALAFPDHVAQAFHHLVVGIVQGVTPVCQQLDCLADAARLVNTALLGDRQMHGQMQKAVALAVIDCAHAGQRAVQVSQLGMVFGVLVDPQGSYCFNSFQRLFGLGFGVNRAKKTADIGLGWAKHSGAIVALCRQPCRRLL